jgi:hypothetical protein
MDAWKKRGYLTVKPQPSPHPYHVAYLTSKSSNPVFSSATRRATPDNSKPPLPQPAKHLHLHAHILFELLLAAQNSHAYGVSLARFVNKNGANAYAFVDALSRVAMGSTGMRCSLWVPPRCGFCRLRRPEEAEGALDVLAFSKILQYVADTVFVMES